jgi:hypothetical protein
MGFADDPRNILACEMKRPTAAFLARSATSPSRGNAALFAMVKCIKTTGKSHGGWRENYPSISCKKLRSDSPTLDYDHDNADQRCPPMPLDSD